MGCGVSESQTWLRSCVAVAVAEADSCSSSSTPSLETCIYCAYSPKNTKNKNQKKILNGHMTQSNLQISDDPYQVTHDIFHRTITNNPKMYM